MIQHILKYQASIICVFEALDGGHLRLKPGGTKTKVMEMLHNYCGPWGSKSQTRLNDLNHHQREFSPDGLVAKTPNSGAPSSILDQGTKIPQTTTESFHAMTKDPRCSCQDWRLHVLQ